MKLISVLVHTGFKVLNQIGQIYLISLFLVCILACPKTPRCTEKYSPSIVAQCSPALDTMRVGDSLYFSVTFFKMVKDSLTGRILDFSTLDFVNSIDVRIRATDTTILESSPGAYNRFKVTREVGIFEQGSNLIGNMKYVSDGDSMTARIKYTPLDTGLYIIRVFYLDIDNKNVLRKYNSQNKGCNIKMEKIKYIVNNGNNNFKLLSDHVRLNPNYYNGVWTDEEKKDFENSTYTFYVKPK